MGRRRHRRKWGRRRGSAYWTPRAVMCRGAVWASWWGMRMTARGGRWMAGRMVRTTFRAVLPRWLRLEARSPLGAS
ncbi:hypothetical protein SAMN05428939_0384 [Streptomyces sp. TLI_105]|nr:hypothetical protein SAMN05428939_0384 [Streptomyces sp. TLI_105]